MRTAAADAARAAEEEADEEELPARGKSPPPAPALAAAVGAIASRAAEQAAALRRPPSGGAVLTSGGGGSSVAVPSGGIAVIGEGKEKVWDGTLMVHYSQMHPPRTLAAVVQQVLMLPAAAAGAGAAGAGRSASGGMGPESGQLMGLKEYAAAGPAMPLIAIALATTVRPRFRVDAVLCSLGDTCACARGSRATQAMLIASHPTPPSLTCGGGGGTRRCWSCRKGRCGSTPRA